MTANRGFIPPISTPLKDGKIDFASLDRLLDALLDHVAGVLVGGSVGEIISLTVDERLELLTAVAKRLGERHSLCFSVADNSIENTRRLIEGARGLAVELLVVSPPNYFELTRPMLQSYLTEVGAQAGTTDLCLYDNPAATHHHLTVEDITHLASTVPNLKAIKVTDLAIGKVEAICASTDLTVYGGDDAVLWHQLVEGAQGAMVSLPLIFPELSSAFWAAFESGDLDEAFRVYAPAAVFVHAALGATDYVAVIKEALHANGFIDSVELRLPLVPLTSHRKTEVRRVLAHVNGIVGRSTPGAHALQSLASAGQ